MKSAQYVVAVGRAEQCDPMSDPFLERLEGLGSLCLSATQRSAHVLDEKLFTRCDAVLRTVSNELQESSAMIEQSRQGRRPTHFYKAVAKMGNRFFSIFDGETEFHIGKSIQRKKCHGRKAAFFVHDSLEAACQARFPASSKALHEHRVILLVRADGCPQHAHGKHTLWAFTPVAEVHTRPDDKGHTAHRVSSCSATVDNTACSS